MVKTGMTRRIDELGRLVIPKEIRKNLKIKDNDQVEITVVDNKIILNKYDNLSKDRVINILLKSIKKRLNKNILLTSRDEVVDYVLSSNDLLEKALSKPIMNIIENRNAVINYYYKGKIYSINPLIINGDLYGSLIIYSENEINNKEQDIIEFSKLFLENYLE